MSTIKIKIITEDKRRRFKTIFIEGRIIGDWGIHKTPVVLPNLFLKTYGITHIPTGYGIGAEGMNKKEATQLAIYLNSKARIRWEGGHTTRKRFREYIIRLINKFRLEYDN